MQSCSINVTVALYPKLKKLQEGQIAKTFLANKDYHKQFGGTEIDTIFIYCDPGRREMTAAVWCVA